MALRSSTGPTRRPCPWSDEWDLNPHAHLSPHAHRNPRALEPHHQSWLLLLSSARVGQRGCHSPSRQVPRSGPVKGNCRVVVKGLALGGEGGTHPCCRFEGAGFGDGVRSASVNATVVDALSGTVACLTPPMSGVEPIALVNVSLELWRHGQLLVTQPAARLPFAVFNDSNDADDANDANDADGADGAAAAALTPTAAPMLGGTLLHFAAARLPPGLTAVGGFLNCSCRFDISATRWDWRAAHTAADALITTPASLSGGDGSGGLQCVSPRVELTAGQMLFGEGGSLLLLLSLNGQQYAPQPTPLHVYPPPSSPSPAPPVDL